MLKNKFLIGAITAILLTGFAFMIHYNIVPFISSCLFCLVGFIGILKIIKQ